MNRPLWGWRSGPEKDYCSQGKWQEGTGSHYLLTVLNTHDVQRLSTIFSCSNSLHPQSSPLQ